MKSKLLIVSVAVSMFVAGYATAAKKKMVEAHTTDELKWGPMSPDNPQGPQMAVLWGDFKKGTSGFLLKVPAGYSSPMHVHSSDYHGVQIQGSSSHPAEGEAEAKQLPPGSHWTVPGGLSHVSKCAAGSDCIMFATVNGKFDTKMVGGKDMKAPAPDMKQ